MTDEQRKSLIEIWAIRSERRIREFAVTLTRGELIEALAFVVSGLRLEKREAAETENLTVTE